MSRLFSDDALRDALRSMTVPEPDARLLACGVDAAPAARATSPGAWRIALAAGLLLAIAVVGALEYQAWQETEELARLDEMSVDTLPLL
ncbi:hypothetical protein [Methyloversatilis thermotolerans]|uniref:hypothetical protein n=1 Tax=Methyloversatilis thermotolerans TaxID=1346290 RepID=UPI00037A9898|nr:hypothetical protein [Methyloversatilis thermotolerans]